MILHILATVLAAQALAAAAAAKPAPAAPTHVSTSAAPGKALPLPPALQISTYTVATLYTGDQVRDPFLPASAASHPRAEGSPDVVDIHSMQLRGIMKDDRQDYAVFTNDFGATLILRAGRLYDDRGRPVPGITGRIAVRQKRVELMTADKDVQPFHLGEASATGNDGDP